MVIHKGKMIGGIVVGALALGAQIAVADSVEAVKVGTKAGLVDVDNLGSTFGIGAYGEIPIAKNVSIRPSIDYWQKTKSSDAGLADVEIKVSDLAFGGAVQYTFDLPGWTARPYLVGGLALHRLSAEVSASSAFAAGAVYSAEVDDTKLGFDLGGGVAYPLSSGMELNGEVMVRNVDTADVTSLSVGLAYKL